MHSITYANENTLMNKPVGGWGGNVGANTRGDFDKKGWTQAGNLVITPTDQLYGPARPCNCHGFPLGGMGLEQAANVSRCSHGQPPVMSRVENFEPGWEVVRRQQLLGTSGSMPYCSALPRDLYYRLDNRNLDCDELYMDNEHDAKVGCSNYSRNYFFGKRNCKYDGRTRTVNGKTKYFCDDGPHCQDR